MKCSYCNKPNASVAKKCVHCGELLSNKQQQKRDIHIQCPLCNIQTDHIQLLGIELDYCHKCNGFWFDRGELRQFEKSVTEESRCKEMALAIKELGIVTPQPERRMYLKCPVCQEQMIHRNFVKISGIVLDRCREHGTWVEQNDILKLLNLINSGELATLVEKASKENKKKENIVFIDTRSNALQDEVEADHFLSKIDLLFDFFDFF